MTDFKDQYIQLIIKQYFLQPNARAEVEFKACQYELLFNLLSELPCQLDVDSATGRNLDIIGRIVGVDRLVDSIVEPINFGFSDNPNARGFACRGDSSVISAPFACRGSQELTALQLDDDAFRQIIRAKIAVNNTSAYVVSDDYISIEEVVQVAFNGLAYVVDNQDMTLTLHISFSFEDEYLRLIRELNLLPKPQGVRYNDFIRVELDRTFGFADNQNAVGFNDRNNLDSNFFAERVSL